MNADLRIFALIRGKSLQALTTFYLPLTRPGPTGRILWPAMKSRRESNARFRLVLTLGLAVVFPALTLIIVNFQHVKSIQRDKKAEALIHRDFQYLLSISAKKMASKAYALTEQVRDDFPADTDSDDEKRRKLDEIISKNPWFTHVFLFDSKKGIILQPRHDPESEKEGTTSAKMYSGWF